jgi:hypothetical protein
MAQFNTVVSAAVSATADGANEIVAAQGAGKKIRVLGYVIVASATNGVKWQSGSTDKSGVMPFGANGGASAPLSTDPEVFWFETAANEALNLNNGTGVDTFGHVTYTVVS